MGLPCPPEPHSEFDQRSNEYYALRSDVRVTPELLAILRAEHETLFRKCEELHREQEAMARKLAQWEASAVMVRWIVIFTVSSITVGMGVVNWLRDHVR
jgi:hypothetical protein